MESPQIIIPYIEINPDDFCGIYAIYCLVNDKFYIGSSCRVRKRWVSSHRLKLRKNIHENRYLQNAWNKYGEENFLLLSVEKTEENNCQNLEQYYLDLYKPYNKEIGYNLSECASRPKFTSTPTEKEKRYNKTSISFKFLKISENKIIEGLNLKKYCRENGLSDSYSGLLSLSRGKLSFCLDYVNYNDISDKGVLKSNNCLNIFQNHLEMKSEISKLNSGKCPFEFGTLDGEVISGLNLAKFCKENSLSYSRMAALKAGRIKRYGNYILVEDIKHIDILYKNLKNNPHLIWKTEGKYHIFLTPSGEICKIINLNEYCKKYNLKINSIYPLLYKGEIRLNDYSPIKSLKNRILISPSGEPFEVDDPELFIERHKIYKIKIKEKYTLEEQEWCIIK